VGIDAARELVDVVVGGEERPGDVARLPLGAFPDVEDLQIGVGFEAPVEFLDVDAFDLADWAFFLAPARHASGQVAAYFADAHSGRELDCLLCVFVVAADEHDRLLGICEPREL